MVRSDETGCNSTGFLYVDFYNSMEFYLKIRVNRIATSTILSLTGAKFSMHVLFIIRPESVRVGYPIAQTLLEWRLDIFPVCVYY